MFEDYEGFKKSIYELTSIDLNAYKERQMRRRIEALITKNKISDYPEFVSRLKVDENLFEQFVNYLTINVSEFYRNPEQWNVLDTIVFPMLIKKFGNKLKIWSAACSTGDEPYSLAMVLSKHISLSNIKIIATDIDNQVLDKARMGIYNSKSLLGLPLGLKKKYISQIGKDSFKVNEDIKSCIDFRRHDLLKDPYIEDCHLIVCRNVLIYFTEEAKEIIFQKFSNKLRTGGVLFIGSTEQIMQPVNYNLQIMKSFFYEKI